MQLRVIINKDIAFSGFVRNVAHLGMYKWIQTWQPKLLKKVSKRFAKEVSSTFNFYLSYERSPKKDISNWFNLINPVIFQLEKIHDKEWAKNLPGINTLSNTLNKIVNNYGNFLIRAISEFTKIPWSYKQIWIIPSLYYGSTTEDNKIFIGVYRPREDLSSTEKRLLGLIHELIHANELPKYLSRLPENEKEKILSGEHSNYKYPNASREITTMLVTNSIAQSVEKKFGLKLKKQLSHPHYAKLISTIQKDFNESPQKDFEKVRIFIDNLISKKEKN